MRCAVCDAASGQVQNIIIADPMVDQVSAGLVLVRVGTSSVDIGWVYANGGFTQTLTPADLAAAVVAEDQMPLIIDG